MKKLLIAICLVAAAFFGGCGKKEETSPKKMVVAKAAVSQEIPLYQYDEDKFFDDEDIADFAFIDDEEEIPFAGVDTVVSDDVKSDPVSITSYDDWDERELPLAWEDEMDEDVEFQTVNFDLNKNAIRSDQKVKVAKNIEAAREVIRTGKKVVVAGHCCPVGSASYNMSLSEKRAKTIRDEMVKGGVPEEQVKILGCGSECPVVLSDAADRAKMIEELSPNRRAEISVS